MEFKDKIRCSSWAHWKARISVSVSVNISISISISVN